jgi:hypothetical protein
VRFFDNTYSFYPGPQHYKKVSIELDGDFKRGRVADVVVSKKTPWSVYFSIARVNCRDSPRIAKGKCDSQVMYAGQFSR